MYKLLCFLGCTVFGGIAVQSEPLVTGVCTHFAQGKGGGGQAFNLFREAGIDSIRDEAYWSNVEKEKGKLNPAAYQWYINAATIRGIKPLTVLSFTNRYYDGGDLPSTQEGIEAYARYCEATAAAFKNKHGYFEIWNEWDAGFGGKLTPCADRMTPESYLNVVKVVYPRLKKAAPEAIILAGAVTGGGVRNGWVDKLVKAGIMNYCDAVSIHSYCSKDGGTPEMWHKWMVDLEQRLTKLNGNREVPLYITEMGWPTQIGGRDATSRMNSAAYLARTLLLARTLPFIKGIWWYDHQDDGWKYKFNEDNFGIQRPDQTPKPAWFAMRDVNRLMKNTSFVRRVPANDPNIWILEFQRSDKSLFWALWASHKDNDWQIIIRKNGPASTPLTVQEIGRPSYSVSWGYRNWGDGLKEAVFQLQEFSLTVRGMPWIISGDLNDTVVKQVTCRQYPEVASGSGSPMLPGKILPVGALPADYRQYWGKNIPDKVEMQTLGWEPFSLKNPKPEDIGGRFAAFYNEKNLFLIIDVRDDKHFQSRSDDGIWQEDSIQLAVKELSTPSALAEPDRISELGIAMTNGVPLVLRYLTQKSGRKGKMETVDAKIIRTGDHTVYWLKIPHYVLDLPPLKPGTLFALSLLVNENDGAGRKGYLCWGGGIGKGKNALEFNWLITR